MECVDAIYSESVMDYIIRNYKDESVLQERYEPICYQVIDHNQTIIYRGDGEISSEEIRRFGYLSIPKCYAPMDQSALEAAGVLRVRRQPNLDLYGQGVLIGIVDSGIDYSHPAFRRADGTSRIFSIWDQTIKEGPPPEEFSYGRVFTNEEINEALKKEEPELVLPTRDETGHGTFMAGVAAGNIVREEEFSGVAPQAELLIVKCKECKQIYRDYYRIPNGRTAYQENDIMMGIAYILSQAEKLNKPIVVCLGVGTNMGNHGGDSQLDMFMEEYNLVWDVCMVVPAGNEGNTRHHFHGNTPTAGEEYVEIDINVENNSFGFTGEIWWQGIGFLSVEIISPSGETFFSEYQETTRKKKFPLEGTTVEVYFGVILDQAMGRVAFLRFEDTTPGIWKIRVYPVDSIVSDFHMWLPVSEFLEGETFFLKPDPDTTICEPGNVRQLITPTAYNDFGGALYLRASRGYTIRNEVKPDFAAPGVNVYGTLPGGRYGSRTGTSVAAALTTGVSALLLQAYPDSLLNGVKIKDILIQGATRQNIVYPNKEWGYGTIDLYTSIRRIPT